MFCCPTYLTNRKSRLRGFDLISRPPTTIRSATNCPYPPDRRPCSVGPKPKGSGFRLGGNKYATAVGRMRCRRRALSLQSRCRIRHAEAAWVREHMSNHLPRRAVRVKMTESGAKHNARSGVGCCSPHERQLFGRQKSWYCCPLLLARKKTGCGLGGIASSQS